MTAQSAVGAPKNKGESITKSVTEAMPLDKVSENESSSSFPRPSKHTSSKATQNNENLRLKFK